MSFSGCSDSWRRDRIAALVPPGGPAGFFSMQHGAPRFPDLAAEVGLAGLRAYDVGIESAGIRAPGDGHIHLTGAELPLIDRGNGASHLSIQVSIAGSRAVEHLELTRKESR